MKNRKSIYYMTDAELRNYKRMKRRKQMLRKKINTLIISLCFVLVLAIGYFSINSNARNSDDTVKYKYYTRVTVGAGDSLWTIADDYIDYDFYKGKNDFIKEICSINHLNVNGDIKKGQEIVVPYYSTEFNL